MRWAVVSGAIVAPVLALAGLVVFSAADEPPPPTLASLARPAQPHDRLDGHARELANLVADADEVRYVGEADGRRAYLGRGLGDTVCLFEIGGGSANGGCNPREALRHDVVWGASGRGTSGKVRLRVYVPDAYNYVVLGRGLTRRVLRPPSGGNAVVAAVPAQDVPIRLEGDGVRALTDVARLR